MLTVVHSTAVEGTSGACRQVGDSIAGLRVKVEGVLPLECHRDGEPFGIWKRDIKCSLSRRIENRC
jgi:hypothetical protein